MMLDMDGVELACETRRRRPDLKVLFTLGYTEGSELENELEGGAERLAKPYRKRAWRVN